MSTNIANANNASYARRETQITTTGQGAAQVSEITRAVDGALDAMYRSEAGRTARQDAIATGLEAYTSLLGDTESSDTVLTRLTDFQSSLDLLAVSSADTALQRAAVTDAQELAEALNRAGDNLAAAIGTAEDNIATEVASVNAALSGIAALSDRLAGQDQSADARLALQDELGAELDALAEHIDFTVRTDSQGRIELFTGGGTALITNGTVEPLSFDPDTGVLSAGEVEITPGVTGKRGISEGSLSGQIALFSTLLPEMQGQLDEVARALIDGMAAADASLGGGRRRPVH